MIIILLVLVSIVIMAAGMAICVAAIYMEEEYDRKNHAKDETGKTH